jgi:hypothetical protein
MRVATIAAIVCTLGAVPNITGAASVGAPIEIDVPSHREWVDTGVDVEPGDVLELTATGFWWDAWIRTSSDGYSAPLFYKAGKTPRILDGDKYFRLMGRIGDRSGPPSTDTQLSAHGPDATFAIGRHVVRTAERSGRLYVFANDRQGYYWNNWGQVRLTITRRTGPPG